MFFVIFGCCFNDFSGFVIVKDFGDIRVEMFVVGYNWMMVVWIQIEFVVLIVWVYQQFFGGFDGEFVRRQSVVDISLIVFWIFNVGVVVVYLDNDVRVVEWEGVDCVCVDVIKFSDKLMQFFMVFGGCWDVVVVSFGLVKVEG